MYENVLVCSFVSMMVQSLRKRLGPPYGRDEAAHSLHYVITMARKNPDIARKWLSEYEVVVIDEGSNVNLKLMAEFLACLPSMKKLIVLGDLGQIGISLYQFFICVFIINLHCCYRSNCTRFCISRHGRICQTLQLLV